MSLTYTIATTPYTESKGLHVLLFSGKLNIFLVECDSNRYAQVVLFEYSHPISLNHEVRVVSGLAFVIFETPPRLSGYTGEYLL